MPAVKTWKHDDPKTPAFPKDYEIIKKVVLQVTDLKTNHNKYYALELHKGNGKGKEAYRLFTHYGRTDEGWLGHGIYFGDAVCTSYFYASPGKRNTCLIAIARVALGKVKQFYKIT